MREERFEVMKGVDREAFLNVFFDPCRKASVEQLCMSLKTDPGTLRRTADTVLAEWEVTMTPAHADFKDAAQHLVSQMRIELRNQKQQQRYGKQTATDPRRPVEPPTDRDGYSDTL